MRQVVKNQHKFSSVFDLCFIINLKTVKTRSDHHWVPIATLFTFTSCPRPRGASCTPRKTRPWGCGSAWTWGRWGRGWSASGRGCAAWSLQTRNRRQKMCTKYFRASTQSIYDAAKQSTKNRLNMLDFSSDPDSCSVEHARQQTRRSPVPQPESIWPPSCFTSHGFSLMRMAVRPRAAKPARAGVAKDEMAPIIFLNVKQQEDGDL
jgi:hypothetical protein